MTDPDPINTGVMLAGALAVAKRVETFLAAASGHPGEDIGTILGNIVDRQRKNAETVIWKSDLILLDLGVKTGEVPLKILRPALEAASLEEDPNMQDVWANLLANAADPRQTNVVHPSFTNMLKELTNREVRFLEAMVSALSGGKPYHQRLTFEWGKTGWSVSQLTRVAYEANLFEYKGNPLQITQPIWDEHGDVIGNDHRNFRETLDVLTRNRILVAVDHPKPIDVGTPITQALKSRSNPRDINIELEDVYRLTELGKAFLAACRRPAHVDEEEVTT